LIENGGRFSQADGVKLGKFIWLLMAVALLAGCKKPGDVAPAPSVDDLLPKQAQPKLRTIKIYLGAETLDAEIALTAEQVHTGMLPVQQRASFWMKNCPESLSAAYIGPDGVIEEIHHLEKNDTNSVVAAVDNVQYVLEVKDGWFVRHNINPGTVIRTEKGSLAETFLRRQSRNSLLRKDAEKTLGPRMGVLPVDIHAVVGHDGQRHPITQIGGGLQYRRLSQRNGQLPGEAL
jgi:uncharacterized membrane protein (UPF0127 family)